METSVLKFGGSSLADAGQIAKVTEIIRSRSGCRFVVVSAPGKRFPEDEKVTDLLYRCADLLEQGRSADATFRQVEERYRSILRDLGLKLSLEEDFAAIRSSFRRPSRDFLASRGEYLSAKLMAAHLGAAFLDAAEGIFFRGDGTLDEEKTYAVLGRLLKDHCRAVIPGFYGSLPGGAIHTFTRGGSDITGAIVARAARADVYENWTDVSGVMMADPRIVPAPRVIPEISYRELRALSRGGASVFHEEAIRPAREGNIPINIRNTNAPGDPGTMIVPRPAAGRRGVTAISGRKGFAVVTVSGTDRTPDAGGRVLRLLADLGLDPVLMPEGLAEMTAAVPAEALSGQTPQLCARLAREAGATGVKVEQGFTLLTVVGRGLTLNGSPARQLLKEIRAEGIPVRLAEETGDGLLLVIPESDYVSAARTICTAAGAMQA